jgi:exopolysaccharide biosynthesis polyprenyl glycosylphosphotransferase
MKRTQLAFAVILVPLDYLLLIAAAVSAYRLRFEALTDIRPALSLIPYEQYLAAAAVLAAGWIFIYAVVGLYVIKRPRRVLEELVKVVSGSTLGIMGVIILIFFRGELFASRFVVLAAWLIAIAYVTAGRLFVRAAQYFLFKRGITSIRTVIVGGDDPTTSAIVQEFSRYPGRGYVIVKRMPRWDERSALELEELMRTRRVDEIFVTDPDASRGAAASIIEFAEDHHLNFRYAADTLAAHADLLTTTIAGIPVIEVKRTRLEGWGRVYKRAFDIIVSILLIVLASPVMLLAAAAVWLDSKGPVIFRNERVGLNGKRFDVFKFRSMQARFSVGEQFPDQRAALAYEQKLIRERGIKEGPVYKIKDDPRVTRVGRFLRRTSVDELPQLFNVLKGDMSLVGPRPHQPREVAKYERHHRRVLIVRPGITGLAQISGRSDLEFEEEVRLDTFYIENWTPLMDLAILLKTPKAALSKKGAY